MMIFFYKLIISPLEYIVENLFSLFFYVFEFNIGFAIIAISFTVTLLCLPFYCRADKIRKEEDEKYLILKPYIEKIKRNFKKDEQFFMLRTLYRQHNYNPIMSLRNSFSLLLQIPFFIAAYHFFSNLELFNGYSCFIIKDLSKPDMLLNISSLNINVLPILMTIINLFSCELYIKTKGFKERIQPYSFAILFLILLYNSPSGLVLYWTCNNFLYLLKNKYMDDSPKKFWWALFSFGLIVYLLNLIVNYYPATNDYWPFISFILYTIVFTAIIILIIYLLFNYLRKTILNKKGIFENISNEYLPKLFIFSTLGFIVLQGLIIPIGLLNSDISSFIIYYDISKDFIKSISENLLCLSGLYLFWGSTIYFLIKKNYRLYYIIIIVSIYIFSVFNYINFGNNIGTINTNLIFDNEVLIKEYFEDTMSQGFNLCAFLAIITSIIYIFKKNYTKLITFIVLTLLITESIISGIYIFDFYNGINRIKKITQDNETEQISGKIELSKTGKNVIIIFLDRFVEAFIPLIFEEKPELKKIYSGFVSYPNTVCYYHGTVLGYPPIVGGYEYTPYALDKDNRNFSEKWLEASLMLPTLFKKNNYISTVVDPVGDFDINMRFYKDDNFKNLYNSRGLNYIKMAGKYNKEFQMKTDNENREKYINLVKRKLYVYSFFNIAAKSIQEYIYNDGNYLLTLKRTEEKKIKTSAEFYASEYSFISAYSALLYIKNNTQIIPSGNTFTLINNDLPHNMHYMQFPNYEYSKNITNIGVNKFDDEKTFQSYHTAMASILIISDYLDYLKESGVYNNSRIILVSDHGNIFIKFPNLTDFQNWNVLPFNPLLLVKDFNQNHDIKADNTFMTNADVPYIATRDIIPEAKNPFTGKTLSIDGKSNGADIYQNTRFWNASHFTSNRVILDKDPLIGHVNGDIFDESNWERVEYKRE